MKIAIFSGTFFPDPGGVQVQVHNLANFFFKKKNLKIDLFLLKKTNIKNNYYNIYNLNRFFLSLVHILKYYFLIDLTFFLTLYLKYFHNIKKYQIFHFHFLNFKSLLLINAIYKINKNIIVTFHGSDIQIKKAINYGNRIDKKFDLYLKSTLKKIMFFTAISKNIEDNILKLHVSKSKIIKIPNGIPLFKFKINHKKKNNNAIKLITVARYSIKKKGFDLFIKLVRILNEKKINFMWYVIGKNTKKIFEDFPGLKKYRKFFKIIDNMNNEDEIFYPGNKLINYYKKSDIYINLARIESFGITFVEALASNIPVITFNSKGANELVKSYVNGFVINNKSLNLVANKISTIKKNKKIFQHKPVASIKNFDLELVANKFYNLYLKCYKNL